MSTKSTLSGGGRTYPEAENEDVFAVASVLDQIAQQFANQKPAIAPLGHRIMVFGHRVIADWRAVLGHWPTLITDLHHQPRIAQAQ